MVLMLWLAAGVLALSGCSKGYEGEDRVPVQGEVTYQGKPITGGSIDFMPMEGQESKASAAIADGKYALEEKFGPNLGKYKVVIYGLEPVPGQTSEEGDPKTEQILPEQYNDRTTLEVEITAEEQPYDFHLE